MGHLGVSVYADHNGDVIFAVNIFKNKRSDMAAEHLYFVPRGTLPTMTISIQITQVYSVHIQCHQTVLQCHIV